MDSIINRVFTKCHKQQTQTVKHDKKLCLNNINIDNSAYIL
jgi:hypothetical protein